jgi:hypothetical protein
MSVPPTIRRSALGRRCGGCYAPSAKMGRNAAAIAAMDGRDRQFTVMDDR